MLKNVLKKILKVNEKLKLLALILLLLKHSKVKTFNIYLQNSVKNCEVNKTRFIINSVNNFKFLVYLYKQTKNCL